MNDPFYAIFTEKEMTCGNYLKMNGLWHAIFIEEKMICEVKDA